MIFRVSRCVPMPVDISQATFDRIPFFSFLNSPILNRLAFRPIFNSTIALFNMVIQNAYTRIANGKNNIKYRDTLYTQIIISGHINICLDSYFSISSIVLIKRVEIYRTFSYYCKNTDDKTVRTSVLDMCVCLFKV